LKARSRRGRGRYCSWEEGEETDIMGEETERQIFQMRRRKRDRFYRRRGGGKTDTTGEEERQISQVRRRRSRRDIFSR
jgi:hypothetical protein